MKHLFFIQLLLSSFVLLAQAPQRFYTKFGGNGVDIGYSAKLTLDKRYIVTGSTSSYGAGNTDVYLVKVDSMGFPIWQQTFGGFNNDVGRSVIQLPDSGYVVAGFTNSFGAGGYDVYVVRTDKVGALIWQKTFGGLDWDFAYDLVLAPDGDIAVVGNTSSFGHGKKDGLFLKFDLFGNLVQQKFIGGIENEELRSIIVTNDLLLASVGYTESKGEINGDCYFVKLNLIGDTILTRSFGGVGKDYLNDIVQKNSGDFVMCGAKTYTSNPLTESLIYSLNSSCAFLWENHYYASTTNEAFVSLTSSKKVDGLTANLRTVPVPLFKLDGNIFITVYFGYYFNANSFCGPEDEILYSIEGTKDGGYLAVGSTLSFGSIGEDVFMIKLDSAMVLYSNLVGIPQEQSTHRPKVLYEDNDVLGLAFENQDLPELVELYDMTGIKQKQVFIRDDQNIKISISEIPPSIYVLKITYKNNTCYNIKVIKR